MKTMLKNLNWKGTKALFRMWLNPKGLNLPWMAVVIGAGVLVIIIYAMVAQKGLNLVKQAGKSSPFN